MALFASLSILANYYLPLSGALYGHLIMRAFILLVLLVGCKSTILPDVKITEECEANQDFIVSLQNNHTINYSDIAGHWGLLQKSETFSDRKSCNFYPDGTFKCTNMGHGCSKSGWCEGNFYLSEGLWKLNGTSLLLG